MLAVTKAAMAAVMILVPYMGSMISREIKILDSMAPTRAPIENIGTRNPPGMPLPVDSTVNRYFPANRTRSMDSVGWFFTIELTRPSPPSVT